MTVERCRWKRIDVHLGAVALANPSELRLPVIRLNPDAALHKINNLNACSDKLSRMNTELAY